MIILDTDFIIELALRTPRAVSATKGWLATGEQLATTSINAAEFLRGAQRAQADAAAAEAILAGLDEIPFAGRDSRRFARLMHALDRAGGRIPELDGMIAAVALENGARVATFNARHFDRVGGLELESV